MSNSLQLKISLIFLIAFIFLLGTSSGIEIGVSPSSLVFEGGVNELICQNLSVYSSRENIGLILNDFWSKFESKNIDDYKFSSDNFYIFMNYPKSIILKNSNSFNVCLISKSKGNYHGLLEIESNNHILGIGIWMNAKIIGEKQTYNQSKKVNNSILNILMFINFLLVLSLFYFAVIYAKNQKKNNKI